MNWGKLAFTTDALDLGLTANRYGVNGNYQVIVKGGAVMSLRKSKS